MQFKFWHAIIVAIGLLISAVTAQECPEPSPNSLGTCDEACSSDSNCTGGQLCCSNGCGHECMSPVEDPCAAVRCAAPNCSEDTADTITPEGQCCPVCGTPPASSNETVPTSTTPPSQTCPTVQSSNDENNCVDECSSDDDCQYDRICCSNGCGGHSCSDSVEKCAVIFCAWPRCEDGAQPVISTFSCCPVCPTTLPTNSTSTNQSTTPSVSPTDPTCPVGGQIRVGCAPPCNTTCANMNAQLYPCPALCVINGCQCPRGMVIDEQSNTCVAPAACSSTAPPTNSTSTNQSTTPMATVGRTDPSQTCPSVQSSNDENCVDECSSDDDCQYDRICCSNGCGGYTCSDSVEMCQLIQCDWPICEDGAQPVTSPFSCCPYCPTNGSTDDNGGTGVTTIASVMTVITCALLNILF